ncbi:hypothetical protein C8F01DRAFT_1088236 [Mycena amicta]|nr:hypothetical protein C8F01DRAFT_1088236 [Mycena amicta]
MAVEYVTQRNVFASSPSHIYRCGTAPLPLHCRSTAAAVPLHCRCGTAPLPLRYRSTAAAPSPGRSGDSPAGIGGAILLWMRQRRHRERFNGLASPPLRAQSRYDLDGDGSAEPSDEALLPHPFDMSTPRDSQYATLPVDSAAPTGVLDCHLSIAGMF